MAEHPLLVFPEPSTVDREKRTRGGGGGKIQRPELQRQADQLVPQFERLQRAMERRRIDLQENTLGIQPEMVLVIETTDPIDSVFNAIDQIEGLEWLEEFNIEKIESGDDFAHEDDLDKSSRSRIFLSMRDIRALEELISLFHKWKENPDADFPPSLEPLKTVFTHLRDIRHWSEEDRIRDTGILDDWKDRIARGQETVLFEAEMRFRDNNADVINREDSNFSRLIQSLQGEILQQCVIPQISYHGLLGKIPKGQVSTLLAEGELHKLSLLRCDDLMYLYPVGQCAVRVPTDPSDVEMLDAKRSSDPLPEGEPLVALFDGLPLARHEFLDGRLTIEDPDGHETPDYQAAARCHGTAMASLICHGDLNEAGKAITRPLYVRPIMKARANLSEGFEEFIPDNLLPVDLVHRAVKRLYEGEAGEPPVAPSIRVINLSVGDQSRPFIRRVSAWARLLDWLSWKYRVLFIVSAGNHTRDIELNVPSEKFKETPQEEREKLLLKAVADDTRNRRLLSPAESINSLTVAATHSNASNSPGSTTRLIDPFPETSLFEQRNIPSPFNAHGPGYRRSIKPDIFLPGGKQPLFEKIVTPHPNAVLELKHPSKFSGQLVAAPGTEGQLDGSRYTRGTSNAAALASRWSHLLFDVLERLRSEHGSLLPEEYDVVLLKTLLVHGSNRGKEVRDLYESSLKNEQNSRTFKDYVGKFLGYGSADVAKTMICTDQRVTVLGVGKLKNGKAHEFSLPLPQSLFSVAKVRRLIITLAWMTPVKNTHRNYRIAYLWFDPKNELAPNRIDSDHRATRRGTVQHEVLKGKNAFAFENGDNITIKVNCRADAGDIPEPIRYGLAVTLEVAEGVNLPIYQEVRDRLRVPVPASTGNES